LVRLILRRDRLLMALWILALGLVLSSFPASLRAVMPTALERQHYADNAGFVALYGPLSGTSLGEFVAWRAGFVPVVVGLISLLTVIRHTRTEEETGRRELLGSAVVGRHAGLAAAVSAVVVANVVLAAVVAVAMSSQHLPAAGSLAFGAELAATGWVFAGVGAVAAQLTSSAGTARGIAVTVLGAAYLLRVVGDLSAHAGGALGWVSWLSPIGWVHQIRPYGGDRWWLLALAAGVTALLCLVAVAVSARRDLGAGLLPARPGPAEASPTLGSPIGLAWRLQRALLAGWTAGFAVLGVVFGALANGIGQLERGNPTMQAIFERMGGRTGLIDAYLAGIMGMLGLIAAGYAIQATLRLRSEEASLRAEPVLATAVGRVRWAGSHLAFSLLGPTVALATAGLTTGLAYGLDTGQVGRQVPRLMGAALLQLPAVWLLAAVAVALFGLAPRFAAVAWAALAFCLVILLVGAAMRLGQWLLDLSPFTHLPKAPGGAVFATPLIWLLAVAVALGVAGLVGLRRRDIPVT
jgi:ABC-2 type transport system permease protein